MSILVTGGAGYIGSHMVLRLLEAQENVVVIDDLSTGYRNLVPNGVQFIEGSIGDIETVSKCVKKYGVTEILHFAGSIVVPESISDPLKYYRNNTCASRNLIEAAVASGVQRFIFSSTAAVYDASIKTVIDEDAPCAPLSPYGMSKLMTERMLKDVAHAYPLTVGVLRYFNVAGADPDRRSGHCASAATHLIKVACQAALGQRDYIEIFGTDYDTPDGTGVRDYVHVSDLVDAHYLMLKDFRAGGKGITLNCGYGKGSSVRDVVSMIKTVSGRELDVRESDRRPGDAAFVVADTTRLKKILDWSPKHNNLRTMVQSAYEWELHLANQI